MSCNKYEEHVFVLAEDDANRSIATGFQLQLDPLRLKRMQVLESAGGWNKVLEHFKEAHVPELRTYLKRFMVLIIDFDDHADRLEKAKAAIPDELADRVFVLGAWSDPESLKGRLAKSYENIGRQMADECRDENNNIWEHRLLAHNAGELNRLREHVRSILF